MRGILSSVWGQYGLGLSQHQENGWDYCYHHRQAETLSVPPSIACVIYSLAMWVWLDSHILLTVSYTGALGSQLFFSYQSPLPLRLSIILYSTLYSDSSYPFLKCTTSSEEKMGSVLYPPPLSFDCFFPSSSSSCLFGLRQRKLIVKLGSSQGSRPERCNLPANPWRYRWLNIFRASHHGNEPRHWQSSLYAA